jgi:hypothetical protein
MPDDSAPNGGKILCPGSGQLAMRVWSKPVCPICHHTSKAGLPARVKPRAKVIVPDHVRPSRP